MLKIFTILIVVFSTVFSLKASALSSEETPVIPDDSPFFDWTDFQGENISYTLFLDGEKIASGIKDSEYRMTDEKLSEGKHTWHVVVSDNFGEIARTQEFSFEYRKKEKKIVPAIIEKPIESVKSVLRKITGSEPKTGFGKEEEGFQKEAQSVSQITAVASSSFIFLSFQSFYHIVIAFLNSLNRFFGYFSRRKAKIFGKVFEQKTKKPLPGALITFINEKDEPVGKCISNIKGEYRFYVNPGKYQFEILGRRIRFRFQKTRSARVTEGYLVDIQSKEKIEINFAPVIPKAKSEISKTHKIIRNLSKYFFLFGWSVAVVTFFLFPTITNFSINLWYGALLFIRRA